MGNVVANYFSKDAVHLHRLVARWSGCVPGEGRRKRRTDAKQEMKIPTPRPGDNARHRVHEDPPKHALGKISMSARADAWNVSSFGSSAVSMPVETRSFASLHC